ncbi:MAG: SagB/ThcOx family dehydrogenase [Myxococcota bacterium]|nr:SagB/ThcOx family dehydrogenase [Myxococcota bacterium]
MEQALAERRSVREFRQEPISLAHLGQLLWAAQGVTHPWGYRTAPSVGSLFPISALVAVRQVDGLAAGLFRYLPAEHALVPLCEDCRAAALGLAALGQAAVSKAPAVICLVGAPDLPQQSYGPRGQSFLHIEAGHVAQNVALQATALGLGSVMIGIFEEQEIASLLQLSPAERPLCLIPVGKR